MAIGNQSTEEMDHKVDWAAMLGVFNLRSIFALIDNGFDPGSFAPQEFIRNRQELIFHVGSELGNPRPVEWLPPLFAQLFGNILSISVEGINSTKRPSLTNRRKASRRCLQT